MPDLHLHTAVREHLRHGALLGAGEQVILAVSGGIDSMVLLELFAALKEELAFGLAVAHFNHLLRDEESDADEAFVRAEAGRRGLECYVERANTRGLAESRRMSVQETARELRYAFLTKLRLSLGFQKIATAHHADDNAETILFNLLRGAGVHGLSGIPAFRRDTMVIRPLLCVTRDEVRAYAETRGVAFREDSSNEGNDYTRNYLRHELLPEIRRQINPNLPMTLLRTGRIFDQLEEYLRAESGKVLRTIVVRRAPNELALDQAAVALLPAFLKEHILLQVAREFTGAEIDFGTVRAMAAIVEAETGTSCSIAKEVVFHRDRAVVAFRRSPVVGPFRYGVERGKSYTFEHFTFASAPVPAADFSAEPGVEFIDADALRGELVLRNWTEGDWFIPLGMTERKKLSDFFIDEKVPLFEKRSVPLLVEGEQVVWVCGKRLDERYKVTRSTTSILQLTYHVTT